MKNWFIILIIFFAADNCFSQQVLLQTPEKVQTGAGTSLDVPQESFLKPVFNSTQQQTIPTAPGTVTEETTTIDRFYQDDLLHYSWIDFGDLPGLRIHRLEMTNAWADFRSTHFFQRPICDNCHRFNSGISFAVQWWHENYQPETAPADTSLPPVLYDLYLDFGWRPAITPVWALDLAVSPGLSTDFRITPPDGFRLKGHAISLHDMLPTLRAVAGVWYLNRNTTKLLPVVGFAWQATCATRMEAIFPQPRIIHTLGCWRGTTWEVTLGAEFGGNGWAFKNEDNQRETIDYRDYRALVGLAWNGKRGQGVLQAGYVFERELRYGVHNTDNFDPGNAWMIRVGWDY
ncbi:MAG: hypothetical protein JNJ77_12550 [Planctomycetia bacterium]|nr:hypothetical protein [Planctomycetia bacterium]